MVNPILNKELKTTMRSKKTFVYIFIYLILMFLAVAAFIYFTQLEISVIEFDLQTSVEFYLVFTAMQLAFIIFISPSITSGSISGERERQTLDILLLTKMSYFSIVFGKLLSLLAMILLLIITALPIFMIVINYSGMTFSDIFILYLFFISVSAMFGSMGIFFSTIFKRTGVATLATYILVFVFCVLNLILYIVFSNTQADKVINTYINYISFILGICTNPFAGFVALVAKQDITGLIIYRSNNRLNIDPNFIPAINVAINLSLTVIFLLLSSKWLKPVKKSI